MQEQGYRFTSQPGSSEVVTLSWQKAAEFWEPAGRLISMIQVGKESEGRELPIADESLRLLAFLGASLSCMLLGVADTLVEWMPGIRNLPWELTNSRQESSVSSLDLWDPAPAFGPGLGGLCHIYYVLGACCRKIPADLTFTCSPFVLCHSSPDQVPGFQNLRRAAVESLCPFIGFRDNSFCTSPPLCGTVCTAQCISNNTN